MSVPMFDTSDLRAKPRKITVIMPFEGGHLVTFTCGHTVFSPVYLTVTELICAVCLDELMRPRLAEGDVELAKNIYSEGLTVGMKLGKKLGVVEAHGVMEMKAALGTLKVGPRQAMDHFHMLLLSIMACEGVTDQQRVAYLTEIRDTAIAAIETLNAQGK